MRSSNELLVVSEACNLLVVFKSLNICAYLLSVPLGHIKLVCLVIGTLVRLRLAKIRNMAPPNSSDIYTSYRSFW